MNQLLNINRMMWGGGLDPDAQAFIDATAITDGTITTAINQLVLDLKSANIWTKMKAIYPFVGGTATTHKYNLKDPRDLDLAFRLAFVGTITHSSTGVLPSGIGSYAETYYNPSINMNANDAHISYYSKTQSTSSGAEISLRGSSYMELTICYANRSYWAINSAESSIANTNTLGLYISNRPNSTTHNWFANGIKTQANVNAGTRMNANLPLFGQRRVADGVVELGTIRKCAFASIGDGLTDTEAVAFNTSVQAFQTTLGRQV